MSHVSESLGVLQEHKIKRCSVLPGLKCLAYKAGVHGVRYVGAVQKVAVALQVCITKDLLSLWV